MECQLIRLLLSLSFCACTVVLLTGWAVAARRVRGHSRMGNDRTRVHHCPDEPREIRDQQTLVVEHLSLLLNPVLGTGGTRTRLTQGGVH